MKKYTILLASFVGAATLLGSCTLARQPYDYMSADEATKDPEQTIEYLLNGTYAQLKGWSDVMHRCGEYAGDNVMIRGTSTDAFYEFISFSRTPNNYRLQSFWDNSYKAIAQSSNIIKMMEEGKSEELDRKIGECYFIRGMMYFYLVRAYGRPYFQSPESNLGVPIVNGTQDDVFGKLPDRSTVKECYEQSISDLKKAIELMGSEKPSDPSYGSSYAAKALLSRIYLFMSGTYDNPNTEYAKLAMQYADEVISSGKYKLLDRAQFMQYNTITPENNEESIFVVRRLASEFSGWDHYYGVGGMYANIGGMGWGEMYASGEYLALLDETGRNDWANDHLIDARAAFIEPQYIAKDKEHEVFRFIVDVMDKNGVQTGYNYVQLKAENKAAHIYYEMVDGNKKSYTLTPVDEAQGIYSVTYNGKTYKGVKDYEMALNRVYPMFYITKCSKEGEESHLHSPVITRLGEVYLNKAEAAAKLGNYGVAREALNMIRERSLPGKGYTTLDASNAAERIDKERQLELAFQAERSYDVFRNGKALTRHYPGPHSPMVDIPATDYRVIYFIPQTAINSYKTSGSTLTQNPTSN